jgi:predicted alpha/beta hydrolase family esterase
VKRVILSHCWTGNSKSAWYPSVAKELRALGLDVVVPDLPNTDNPVLRDWVDALRESVSTPGDDVVLVGHSLGCANILHYLDTLSEGERVAAVVFVAGVTDDLGFRELKGFFEHPFDYARIKGRAGKFYAIHSDNDPYAKPHFMKHAEVFLRELRAQITIVPGGGHFSPSQGCTVLPEAVYRVMEAIRL